MKMLFKGHSTRLELLIEKIHSNKEVVSCQDSEISGSTSSECRVNVTDNVPESNPESPKYHSFSDTEEEREWEESKKNGDSLADDKDSDLKFRQFFCQYCPRQFKHKRSRDRHIKLHTGDKKYKCLQCESAFARSDHLKIHMKTHDVKKQYKCLKCNKGYNTVSAFTFHEKSHRDKFLKGKFLSSSEEYDDTDFLQSSVCKWNENEDNLETRTVCIYCFQWFSSMEFMKEHIQICHRNLDDTKNITDKKSHGTYFDYDMDITQFKRPKEDNEDNQHKKVHYDDSLETSETFICSCCYQRLPNFESFLVHMETHVTSVKSKSCDEEARDSLAKNLTNSCIKPVNNVKCCCQCNRFFDSTDKLQEHLVKHHIKTLYKCSLCAKEFEDISSMKTHLFNNHITNTDHFECNCSGDSKLFHDRVSAEHHFSTYHNTVKWKDLKTNGLQDDVLKNSASSVYRCPYCKEFCKSRNDLQLHMKSHQVSDKSRHKCNICDETFDSSPELATHKLTHCKIIEGNICAPCKMILMDEESFVKHQLKHNDNSKSTAKLNLILPSICIVCGQTLQSDGEIDLHAKFHLRFLSEQSGSRVTGSPYSEEAYSISERNKIKTAVVDASFELQCHLCKKSFPDKGKLQIHLIEHNFSGINHYSCYICSSVFTGAAGLQSHLLAHNLTEKPYQCSRCSAGFFFRAELDNHKYLHNFKLHFDCLSDESIAQARNFTNAWVPSEMSTVVSR